ncbi:hypothetical protein [Alicyclobacillus sp. ALC3]|uniref:hypothetical protein n=1 Tax=Alicyclobacillus sp. ALC3 TaxID=2796143 RepID=UPI0023797B86|nr:hypothetical protein [Alicyclobacillus sp. ALC3]WDL96942.1 hypothetical protein JC200_22130 [Alicyclobacillus sp. ALC3]
MWVKHPTIDRDGEISIATPNGAVSRKMVGGIFEWPDGVPIHNRFTVAEGPEELVRERRRQQVQEKVEELKALGIDVPDSLLAQIEEPASPVEPVQDAAAIAEKQKAVDEAQAALDADPENPDLKKALTAAKGALTKAKKAAE